MYLGATQLYFHELSSSLLHLEHTTPSEEMLASNTKDRSEVELYFISADHLVAYLLERFMITI